MGLVIYHVRAKCDTPAYSQVLRLKLGSPVVVLELERSGKGLCVSADWRDCVHVNALSLYFFVLFQFSFLFYFEIRVAMANQPSEKNEVEREANKRCSEPTKPRDRGLNGFIAGRPRCRQHIQPTQIKKQSWKKRKNNPRKKKTIDHPSLPSEKSLPANRNWILFSGFFDLNLLPWDGWCLSIDSRASLSLSLSIQDTLFDRWISPQKLLRIFMVISLLLAIGILLFLPPKKVFPTFFCSESVVKPLTIYLDRKARPLRKKNRQNSI